MMEFNKIPMQSQVADSARSNNSSCSRKNCSDEIQRNQIIQEYMKLQYQNIHNAPLNHKKIQPQSPSLRNSSFYSFQKRIKTIEQPSEMMQKLQYKNNSPETKPML